jgi:PleD family two-component response regulator
LAITLEVLLAATVLVIIMMYWLYRKNIRFSHKLSLLNRRLKSAQIKLRSANKSLSEAAFEDSLTGIANRRAFNHELDNRWALAQRNSLSLAILMIDIDFFKLYNDQLGHIAGDACLRKVAQALKKQSIRGSDFIARYGGEEFAIILVGQNEEQVKQFANLCVACVLEDQDKYPFLQQADENLYQAKENGRNQVFMKAC